MLHISRSRLNETKGLRKAKKAYKIAISDLIENGDAIEIYASIHKALNSFVNAKSQNKVERSTSELLSWINQKTSSLEISNRVKEILDRGDAVRFAPVSDEKSRKDINDITTILKELDNKC